MAYKEFLVGWQIIQILFSKCFLFLTQVWPTILERFVLVVNVAQVTFWAQTVNDERNFAVD